MVREDHSTLARKHKDDKSRVEDSHHAPVLDFDDVGLDIGLIVKTGYVNNHSVVTVDQARVGGFPCTDGVLVNNLTVVCLNITWRQILSTHIPVHLHFIHFYIILNEYKLVMLRHLLYGIEYNNGHIFLYHQLYLKKGKVTSQCYSVLTTCTGLFTSLQPLRSLNSMFLVLKGNLAATLKKRRSLK